MKKSRHWVLVALAVCLSLQGVSVLADTKSVTLKEYLPKIDLKLGGVYGPTDAEDNAINIARSILPPGNIVSLEKVVKAIVIKNPDAFSSGNSKKLKVGFLLKLPTLEEVQDPLGQKKAEAHKLKSLQSDNEFLKKENAELLLKLQAKSNSATVISRTADTGVTQESTDPSTVILGSILVPVSTSDPNVIDKAEKQIPLNSDSASSKASDIKSSKKISPVSSLLTEEGN